MDKVEVIDQQDKLFSKIEPQMKNMNLSELWNLLESTDQAHDEFKEKFGYDFTKELSYLMQRSSIKKEIKSRA